MHKRLKNLIDNTKEIFSTDFLDRIARKTGFIIRRGKIDAKTFLAFNSFSGYDIGKKSLSTLSARLQSQYNVSLSPQALNERFSNCSADFMKEVFKTLILKENKILNAQNYKYYFNRIIVNDSTVFDLPERFYSEFKGNGGVRSKSAIKIQLQYDLLSGNFICCDTFNGSANDASYIDTMNENTKSGDLRLADLGYYKAEYFKNIDEKEAFFISKIKSTLALYRKNYNPRFTRNGKLIKSSEYIKIDALELIKPLADGETIELKDIYIGSKKELKSRLIITKLLEEGKQKRKIKQEKVLKRECRKKNNRNMAWTELNAYITNVPETVLSKEQIHDIYSLRWQIEIMFKIWKSVFKITEIKNVKIERFKCFLYGRLISILFSSTIVFSAKHILHEENSKEISELKAFSQVYEFFPMLRTIIFKDEISILYLLGNIINTLRRFAIKSVKRGKKSIEEILNHILLSESNLSDMVI